MPLSRYTFRGYRPVPLSRRLNSSFIFFVVSFPQLLFYFFIDILIFFVPLYCGSWIFKLPSGVISILTYINNETRKQWVKATQPIAPIRQHLAYIAHQVWVATSAGESSHVLIDSVMNQYINVWHTILTKLPLVCSNLFLIKAPKLQFTKSLWVENSDFLSGRVSPCDYKWKILLFTYVWTTDVLLPFGYPIVSTEHTS